jgi:hypothetical protein
VLRKIDKPRFLAKWVPQLQEYTTEDKPFFDNVRAAGYQVYLDHDASKMLTHWGMKGFPTVESGNEESA